MTNKSIDYLFVYFNARENRLDEGKNSPEEFFYGLQYFKRIGLNSKTKNNYQQYSDTLHCI